MDKKYSISFVIPIFKSEKTIESVISDIEKMKMLDWQAVLVNDNTPDNVDLVIKNLIKKYKNKIIYIELVKNGGQQSAIITGLTCATKEFVATIDDDGQNPPSEIIKMLNKMISDKLDIVYGEMVYKQHSRFRIFISNLNTLLSRYTIGNLKDIPISNVRLMRNYIAKGMSQASSQHNYIEGLAFMLTDRIGSVPINHKARINGKSGYTSLKLLKLWSNHVIGYSNIFLKFISVVSLVISLLAFMIGIIYLSVTYSSLSRPTGWLSTYLTITILFSFMFLIISILAEYIGRIYTKINQSGVKIIRRIDQ